MALLRRLFGRGEPAPEVQVHPDDEHLVSEADRKWWTALTLKDCQVMEHQDNVWKVSTFTYYMEEEGLSEEEAARRVRKAFASTMQL